MDRAEGLGARFELRSAFGEAVERLEGVVYLDAGALLDAVSEQLADIARHYGVTIAALVESGEPAPAAQGAVVQFPPCPASEIYYGLNRRGQAEYIRYGEYLSGQPEFRAERPVRFI